MVPQLFFIYFLSSNCRNRTPMVPQSVWSGFGADVAWFPPLTWHVGYAMSAFGWISCWTRTLYKWQKVLTRHYHIFSAGMGLFESFLSFWGEKLNSGLKRNLMPYKSGKSVQNLMVVSNPIYKYHTYLSRRIKICQSLIIPTSSGTAFAHIWDWMVTS